MKISIKIDPYATHLPILAHILRQMTGEIESILEIGGGFYSTPLLATYAHDHGIAHVLAETDRDYAAAIIRLNPIGLTQRIKPALMNDPIDLPEPYPGNRWGLVLIDGAPGEVRVLQALHLRECADLIVLHDSEPESDPLYKYSKIVDHWKYRRNYTHLQPHTMALTDNETIWKIIEWPQVDAAQEVTDTT